MANRGERFDPHVHTICDLKRLGSAQLPQMYRGRSTRIRRFRER